MRHALLAATALIATPALAQSGGSGNAGPGPEATVVGHVNKFKQLDPDPASLRVPAGFRVDLVARDLGNARMLAVAYNGTVYLTRRAEGDVQMLVDANRDGVFEAHRTIATRPNMHGIAIAGSTMYLVTIKDLYSAPIKPNGTLGPLTLIVDDLPDAGQHPNRTIAVGPDGKLYITVGSTCNACAEDNPENATIVHMNTDGTGRQVFASGLRNTIGFDWNPRDGQLWGLDHGTDWLGDEEQPSEINPIDQFKRYGWPYVYGAVGENPQDRPPAGLTMADWKTMSVPMALGHTAHAAPMQMAFGRGTNFPAAMQGDVFAAYRGSWNRLQPAGFEVVRIRFGADGRAMAVEPFLTGWLKTTDGQIGWSGRPTGLAFEPGGTMLVTDPENGALYRVSYTGTDRPARALAKARPMAGQDRPRPIASQEPTLAASGRLTVRSADFAAGGAIPRQATAYGQNISPALSWSAGPAGTRAYAIVAEDPDAGTPQPIVHWLAWNLPADVTSLPSGVGGGPQLVEPRGMRQGVTQRGTLGWFGPRPPVGDRAHGYHLQVFALDRELDLLPGATRAELTSAMAGHVLAQGELVGRYAQPTKPN